MKNNEFEQDEKFDRYPEQYLAKITEQTLEKESRTPPIPDPQSFAQYKSFTRDPQVIDEISPTSIQSLDQSDQRQNLIKIMNDIKSYHLPLLKLDQFTIDETKSQKNMISPKFDYKIIRHLSSWEIIEFHCKLGTYSKTLVAINSHKKSPIYAMREQKRYRCTGNGYNSFIFDYDYNGQEYVFKCFFKPINHNQITLSFSLFLQQVFIAQMMSALEIGPRIIKFHGFDFAIYNDCMQFCMENCQTNIHRSFYSALELDLFKMHSFSICHMDIKPSNIAYSPYYKKPVFIDFDVSRFVCENINEQTLTEFIGTYKFTSIPMRNILNKKGQDYVNLYLNDALMLRNTFNQVQLQNIEPIIFDMYNLQDRSNLNSNRIININEEIKMKNLQRQRLNLYENLLLATQTFERALKNGLQTRNIGLNYRKDSIRNTKEIINIQSWAQKLKFLLYKNSKIGQGFFFHQRNIQIRDLTKNLRHLIKSWYTQLINQKDDDIGQIVKSLIFFILTLQGTWAELQQRSKIGKRQFQRIYMNELTIQQKIYETQNNLYMNCHQIVYSKPVKYLMNIYQNQTPEYLPIIYSPNSLNILSNQQDCHNNFCNKKNALSYLSLIYDVINSIKPKYMIENQKKIQFSKVYHQLKKNIQVFTFGKDYLQNIADSQNLTIKRLVRLIDNSLPEQDTYDIALHQVILTYKDFLTFILTQNFISLHSNNESLFEFCFVKIFSLLKSMIFFKFKYQYFIKDYLQKAMQFLITHRQMSAYFLCIMVKQSIQTGLILRHFLSPLRQNQRQKFQFSCHVFDQQMFLLEKPEIDINDFRTPEKYQKFNEDWLIAQNLWIFFNPSLAKRKLSFQVVSYYFQKLSKALEREYSALCHSEKYQKIEAYQEIQSILQDFFQRQFLQNQKQNQKIKNMRSLICFTHQNSYMTIFERSRTKNWQYVSGIQVLDYNLLRLPQQRGNEKKSEFNSNYAIYNRNIQSILKYFPNPPVINFKAKIKLLFHQRQQRKIYLQVDIRHVYANWKHYIHQWQKLNDLTESLCQWINHSFKSSTSLLQFRQIIAILFKTYSEMIQFFVQQRINLQQAQQTIQNQYVQTLLLLLDLYKLLAKTHNRANDFENDRTLNQIKKILSQNLNPQRGNKSQIKIINNYVLVNLKLMDTIQNDKNKNKNEICVDYTVFECLINLSIYCRYFYQQNNRQNGQQNGYEKFWRQIIEQIVSLLSSSLLISPNIQVDKHFFDVLHIGVIETQISNKKLCNNPSKDSSTTILIQKSSLLYDMLYAFTYHIDLGQEKISLEQITTHRHIDKIKDSDMSHIQFLHDLKQLSYLVNQLSMLFKVQQNPRQQDFDRLRSKLQDKFTKFHSIQAFFDQTKSKLRKEIVEQALLAKVFLSKGKLQNIRNLIKNCQLSSFFSRQNIKQQIWHFLKFGNIKRVEVSKKKQKTSVNFQKEKQIKQICSIIMKKRLKYVENKLCFKINIFEGPKMENQMDQQNFKVLLSKIISDEVYQMRKRKQQMLNKKMFLNHIDQPDFKIRQRAKQESEIKKYLMKIHHNLSEITRLQQK